MYQAFKWHNFKFPFTRKVHYIPSLLFLVCYFIYIYFFLSLPSSLFSTWLFILLNKYIYRDWIFYILFLQLIDYLPAIKLQTNLFLLFPFLSDFSQLRVSLCCILYFVFFYASFFASSVHWFFAMKYLCEICLTDK